MPGRFWVFTSFQFTREGVLSIKRKGAFFRLLISVWQAAARMAVCLSSGSLCHSG